VIAIVNESSDVDAKILERAVRAIQRQIDRDFFPVWGWRATLSLGGNIPKRSMRVTIKESSTDPDDDDLLGYHFIDGLPRTEVFTRERSGALRKDIYAVISHEVLEMIADPGANLYAEGFYLRGKRRYAALVSLEVCDPVQDRGYSIYGIRVSDFVVPEWFEPERERHSLKFSHCDSVHGPFEMTRGGYADVLVRGGFKTVWGMKANRAKRRHRHHARKHGRTR
jgi:hypothetical protein